MTDTLLLDKKIKESGLKKSFILKKLGISKTTFMKRQNGSSRFKAAEIYVISDLLNLSEEDRKKIFFANEVDSEVNHEGGA